MAHVARCLGVRYIATGTLQRGGGRLRLSFRLEEADGGRVLWAERFDGSITDIFAFQEEVAATIAARLVLTIRQAETQRRSRDHVPVLGSLRPDPARPGSEPALPARVEPARAPPVPGRRRARPDLWPRLRRPVAQPQLRLALRLGSAARAGPRAGPASRPRGGAARRGRRSRLRRTPATPISIARSTTRHWPAYERALKLNPNDADILVEYADALVYNDEPQRSVGLIERAMKLNPLYPDWYLWYLADAYDALGRSQDVIATVHRMRNPDEGRRLLAANYAHLGPVGRRTSRGGRRSSEPIRTSAWRLGPADRPIATRNRSSG